MCKGVYLQNLIHVTFHIYPPQTHHGIIHTATEISLGKHLENRDLKT